MSHDSDPTGTTPPGIGARAEQRGWQQLRSVHLLPALARQERLSLVLEGRPWSLDLTTATATFAELTTRVSVLGSYSESADSWRWAWAQDILDDLPDAVRGSVRERANSARETGTRFEIDELREPDVPSAAASAWELALIGSALTTPAPAIYRGPYPGGAVFFSVDDLELPPLPPTALLSLATTTIFDLDVDHQTALVSLFTHEGLTVAFRDDEVVGTRADFEVRARFDESGRLSKVDGTVR